MRYSDNAISAITRFYYGENHDFTNQYFPHHLFAFSLNNMPTITPEEETLIQQALQGVRNGKFPNFSIAARHYGCNYDVLRA